jgi:ubiquinone/menaquinone biosynthesis C-methylase UbiE
VDARSVSFDRAAEYYDATRGRSATGTARETAVLAAALPHGASVLEIGVGTGQVAIPLHAAGVSMVGLDLSLAMMAVLMEKAGGRPPFPLVNGDATALPFGDDRFDAALFRWVLHLIPSWRDALAELARVVRPGGLVLATLGGAGSGPKGAIRKRFAELAGIDGRPAGLDWSDFGGLDEAFRRHGAVIGELEPFEDQDTETVEEYMQLLADDRFSWTWSATEEARRRAAVEVRAWAEAEFGALEELPATTYTVRWRTYRLP